MKKLYTALMLTAMSMGAMAADYIPVASSVKNVRAKGITLPEGMKKVENINPDNLFRKIEKSTPATRTEAIGEDLVGEFCITYTDMYHYIDEDGTPVILNSIGEIEENMGEYTMTFPFLYVTDDVNVYGMQFPIHINDNKITFETQSYRTDAGTLELRVYEFIENGEESTLNPLDEITAEFTGSGFSFDKKYMFTVYDPSLKGGYFMAAYSTFQRSDASASTFNMGWKSLGQGMYQDGWMMSLYQEGQQSNPEYMYSVEIQQSEIDENVYRILNPYGSNTPFATVNEGSGLCGSIQFNVSDPEHVYFQAVPTNYMNTQQGISQFYATNNLTIYVEGLGWDIDSAIKLMGDYDLWATLKDGVLTVPSRYNADTDSYQNDALFCAPEMGLGVCPYFGSNWSGPNHLPLNMECKLWFPGVYEAGVEGIEADNNAPVKYYNLQGVEVANPEKGQLLIKRQGGKAEKIVF